MHPMTKDNDSRKLATQEDHAAHPMIQDKCSRRLTDEGTGWRARRKESFTRLCDSTKHSGATVVGLPFGYPTVVVPGSRQGKPIEAHEVYRVAQVAG